jgi:hypothetical protein
MNVLLKQRDWIRLAVVALGLSGLMVTGWFIDNTLAIGFALIAGIAPIILSMSQNHREMLQNRRENRQESGLHFAQTEALFGLYFSLSDMLPPSRDYGMGS